jgi:uncharacterized membrane-anchored protein
MTDVTRLRLTVFLFTSRVIIGVIGGAGVTEAVFYHPSHATGLGILSAGAAALGLLFMVLSNFVYRSKMPRHRRTH